jgi:hypothetical protein
MSIRRVKRSKTFLRRKWSCRRGAEGNYPAHYLLPTGTLGIASLPTDEVGSRQMVMPERSRRQLSSALSSSNGNVGHSFASDG